MSDIAQPHDRFLKALLSDPQQAGTLLRERLPKAIAECLTDDPPELVEGSFVDEELRSHLTDRLYAVRTIRGRPAFLYVVIEHKSQPERRITWQLAKYQFEALKQWEREHPDWDFLPAIVPFVFYHGSVEWRVPDEFLALVDAEEGWKPYLLNFRYIVCDLGRIEDHELSRHPRLKAWLTVIKYGTRDFVLAEVKGRLIEVMVQTPDDLPVFIRYMVETYENIGEPELREIIRGVRPGEENKMMSQFAQEIIKREKPHWTQEGIQIGISKGRQEGLQEGEAALLKRQLQRRFGSLPSWAEEKMRAANTSALETWGDRILDAKTLDDVFKAES